MRLIYQCGHCEARSEWDVPDAVGQGHTAEDILAASADVVMPRPAPRVAMWIRHPCGPGIHGIAPLVAVIE
jgi:hypothetical protein